MIISYSRRGAPPWVLSGATIDLDFSNNQYYSQPSGLGSVTDFLSCTRASTSYGTTSVGALTSFSSNVLRITDLGLLLEEARTNIAINSAAFDQWTTSATGAVVTADTTVAPDGTTTGDTIAFAVDDFRYANRTGLTNAAAAPYTFSVWLKGTNGNKIGLRFHDGSATTIIAGLVTISSTWTRYTVTGNLAVTSGIVNYGFENRNAVVAGANGSPTLQAWGAQLEPGSFATSYIPTTSASVTRPRDVVTGTAALLAKYNSIASTVFSKFYGAQDNGGQAGVFSFNDGTANNRFDMRSIGGSSIISNGGVLQALMSVGVFSSGSLHKAIVAATAGSAAASKNGAAVVTDTPASMPASVSRLDIGTLDGGSATQYLNQYISRWAYWNSRLANGVLPGLTT